MLNQSLIHKHTICGCWNSQFRHYCGTWHCSGILRILRLPFPINYIVFTIAAWWKDPPPVATPASNTHNTLPTLSINFQMLHFLTDYLLHAIFFPQVDMEACEQTLHGCHTMEKW